jgi:hypothetical protein
MLGTVSPAPVTLDLGRSWEGTVAHRVVAVSSGNCGSPYFLDTNGSREATSRVPEVWHHIWPGSMLGKLGLTWKFLEAKYLWQADKEASALVSAYFKYCPCP